ncbi:lycopene cyclase domain-containing protein [Reichenbachiella ulvae]|uniref:Lycopene cyclase domain-containing protein n=1 Tax=Reichenbachiella ulvae TaxID=2980104 RepID=A0ABT3CPF9_9BACT|nr:lycopene cyclase domain-containing protein [Reichenbachiella ulvae]MCV9385414.1 lycopene cyclase domain-containing protein [Reichenbachiella ulvae]
MKAYTYLAIDLGALLIPFLFSFHHKLRFDKEWKYYLPAMVLVAIPFLIWDEYFTQIGIWGFNPDYLSGIYLGHLPLEEVMFFICIPYACVFTYHCFKIGGFNFLNDRISLWISLVLSLALIAILSFYFGRFYTTSTFILLPLSILYLQFIKKAPYLKNLYFAYFFLQVPFFITNGLLTGSWIDQPIVWYDDSQNMGFRIATIPFEDTFYGMLLILWNIAFFEGFKAKFSPVKEN